MTHRALLLLGALVFAAGLCAGCDEDPADVAGDYSISTTNRENGCNFNDWTEGDTITNVPLMITQSGESLTGEVSGAWGTWLDLVLGSRIFTGKVDGDEVDMTLHGTNSASDGGCTWFVNAHLTGTLSGDVLTGNIRYTPATNGHPDCSTIEGCVSRQEFNGTRPPS
jgi:hypothetical protein